MALPPAAIPPVYQTSGNGNWNPAVTEIIEQALRQLGVIAEDEIPTGDMYLTGMFQLNTIVAAAQATGLHVWTEEEGILFLQPGKAMYEIGGPVDEITGATLNAHTSDSEEWERLTLAASAIGGEVTISVVDPGLAVIDQHIGVILDDHVTHWTTIALILGTTITLADPLPSSASSGNYAVLYTTPITRPLKLPAARLLYLNNLNEVPMLVQSRQEYMDSPNKFSKGPPTQFFYSPRRDRGLLYIWPVPIVTQWAVRFTWYRGLQDFFEPNNAMDFPQEWAGPLMWVLAKDLMGIYDTPPQRQQYIMTQATAYGDLAVSYDRESEPIQFGIDYMGER